MTDERSARYKELLLRRERPNRTDAILGEIMQTVVRADAASLARIYAMVKAEQATQDAELVAWLDERGARVAENGDTQTEETSQAAPAASKSEPLAELRAKLEALAQRVEALERGRPQLNAIGRTHEPR